MKQKHYQKRRYRILAELRELREARDMTRKMLSHRTGYHLATVGRWERGETLPSLQAMADWCEALDAELSISCRWTR